MSKKLLKYKFLFLSIVFIGTSLYGQDPYYMNYDIPDGLPSSEVYDVEVDEKGLVWFATDRGVCNYNGYEFKTYTTQNGLADNTNFEIYRDSKNRLWFNGYNGTLSIYENGGFRKFNANDTLQKILKGNWVSTILELQDGTFYGICQRSLQPSVLHFSNNDLISIINLDSLEELIKVPPKNNILKLKERGIIYNTLTPSEIKFKTPPILKEILKHKGGWIFVENQQIYKCDDNGDFMDSLMINKVVDNISIDNKNRLLLATEKGVLFFEGNDFSQATKPYFSKYYITSCAEDLEGNYWFTTVSNGVLFVPSFDIYFIRPTNENNKRILSTGSLKNQIYFGCANPRLIEVDSSGIAKEHILTGSGLTKGLQIKGLHKNNDTIYLPGHILYEENRKVKIQETGEDIHYYYFLKNGQVFLYAGERYIVRGRKGEKNLIEVSPHKISAFKEDDEGNLWIGTLNGLYKIKDYDYLNWNKVLFKEKEILGRISDIQIDSFSNRWISTLGNGLFYHSEKGMSQIKKENGLNSDLINNVLVLNDSTLIVGTNRGLNGFNYYPEEDTLRVENMRSFTREDGLSSNNINSIEYWRDKIWLATNNGISFFDPELLNRKNGLIPIRIDEFMVNDSSFSTTEHVELRHNENDVFINYTGISFRRNQANQFYKYRLKSVGDTPEWFYTNEKNIRYNNLSSGQYVFEVTAQNKSNEWSVPSATLSFEIRPHFINTLWFKLLASIIILSLLAGGYYLQVRRFRAKELSKRQLQEAEARIREAELNALRNQMNPHFVFNSLNSIQNFIFKKDIENANYYLARFSTLMRNSLQYTRLEAITLRKEIAFLENYLELESMRFGGKFEYKFSVDQSLDIDDLMIPSLLIQPVLENAIKHGFKNIDYKGLLEIFINQKDEERLSIIVRDNGLGVLEKDWKQTDVESKHQSFGLEIIYDRIKLLNETNSQIDSTFEYNNLKNDSEETIGFQVTFLLAIKNK